jgi:hypothetical protein
MHFSISIAAPKEKVWRTMLEQETYRKWTDEFAAGSYYEGSWEQGKKILFLEPEGCGMSSVIAESKPYSFVSIKHLGYVRNGVEDTESPEIKAWAPAFENYTFDEKDGITEVQVDLSTMPQEFDDYMTKTWPKALVKLKALCEQHT